MGGDEDKTVAQHHADDGAGRRVFVSYASPDVEIANTACRLLESRGIPCWIAPRDVPPGGLYADAILRAINECAVMLLVLSASAVASAHVGKEVERASSKRKRLIALRTDAAVLSPSFEYFLSESHWIDAHELGLNQALEQVAVALSASTPGPLPASAPAGSNGERRTSSAWGRVAIAIGLTALVLLAGGSLWMAARLRGLAAAPSAASVPTPAKASLETVSADRSVAVMPFADLSEKKDQAYFAEGIAEEILDRLAQVPSLKVVGRASSFQFKDPNADDSSIGSTLGVSYLLKGSVRKEAGRVRVSAQLIDTKTGSPRWSDRFESSELDALTIQDTIATEIATALKLTVEVDAGPRASFKSPPVLDTYLRGLQALGRGGRDDCLAAVAYFQKVLALDGQFAPAAISLAKAYVAIGYEAWLPPKVAFERARDAAQLALRLDPHAASAHTALAYIHIVFDWDWAAAQQEVERAFALAPRDAYGVQAASTLAAALGHWDDARQLAAESIALDPLSAESHVFLGFQVYLRTNYFAEAEQEFRRGLQIAPAGGSYRYFLGVALLLQGQHEAALTEFGKEALDDGQLEGKAMVEFALGHKAASDALLNAATKRNGVSWPSEIARVHAFRGERDQAFLWLNKAYEARDEDLYFVKDDRLLENLKADPRYGAFLRKMNLPE